MNQENKNKIISGGTTALVLGLILIICLCVGFDPPDPPIPEYGVEVGSVDMGSEEEGSGDNQPESASSSTTSASRSERAPEKVITQNNQKTTPVPTSDNTTPSTKETTTPSTPSPIDMNDKWNSAKKKMSSNNNGNGSGSGTATSGGKGMGSAGQGSGGGNSGAGYSLTGRSAKALPSPSISQNKEGKVVVKIWVDRNGNVIRTSAPEKGSTLTDQAYVNQSKTAAMKAKFSSNEDAPEEQVGTITYVFRNN